MTWDTLSPTEALGKGPFNPTKVWNFSAKSMDRAFKLVQELASAKSPTDVTEAVIAYNREAFELLVGAFGEASTASKDVVEGMSSATTKTARKAEGSGGGI